MIWSSSEIFSQQPLPLSSWNDPMRIKVATMIPLEPYLCGKGADREGELPPSQALTFPRTRWSSMGFCRASRLSFPMILAVFLPLKMLFSPLCWFTFSTLTAVIYGREGKVIRKKFPHLPLKNKVVKETTWGRHFFQMLIPRICHSHHITWQAP